MTPLPILDLVAGMIFIFFLLAIVNNSIIEIISAFWKLRAKRLKAWLIETFLENKKEKTIKVTDIVDHPLLTAMSLKGEATSYFDPKNFAAVLIQLIWKNRGEAQKDTKLSLEALKQALKNESLLPGSLRETFIFEIEKLEKAGLKAEEEIMALETRIANWYDAMMERLGSRFKRQTLKWTMVISSVLTFGLNIDSLSLAEYFYANPQARAQWAQQAYAAVEDSSYHKLVDEISRDKLKDTVGKDTTYKRIAKEKLYNQDSLVKQVYVQKEIADQKIRILQAGLPIGWNQGLKDSLFGNGDWSKWDSLAVLKKFIGFLITICAMAMGAPFWFEVLGKLANIRSAIKPKS